jgi:chemotaxis protein histidine kinase CheA
MAADSSKQRLAELGARFLERTAGEMAQLHDSLLHFRNGDGVAAERIELLAHRIRGTGATLGFESISECADVVESLAAQLREDRTGDPLALEQLTASTTRLADEVQRVMAMRAA